MRQWPEFASAEYASLFFWSPASTGRADMTKHWSDDMSDKSATPGYADKKAAFSRLLTIFGRKPVLEALQDPAVEFHRLHLADSNRSAGIVQEIEQLAAARNIEVVRHTRVELGRISRNQRQDQGVAADLALPNYGTSEDFIKLSASTSFELLALDGVTNPQNVGMIIRSVCASPLDGLLYPRKGCAPIDGLVIKASAGTLFRTPLLRCDNLANTLRDFKSIGTRVIGLNPDPSLPELDTFDAGPRAIFVLGNESSGMSAGVAATCDTLVRIPMYRDVESLNVSASATLVAFRSRVNPALPR